MLYILSARNIILLTKVTDTQNEVTLSYHRVRGLYFLAVVFVATIVLLPHTGPKHFSRISNIMTSQSRNVSLWSFVC